MRDEWFVRGRVPMTKSEVRAVSISKLELKRDSVLYDIGAGTGSVSVEAALQLPAGKVYAVERDDEAVGLIRQNLEKFGVDNVTVIRGEAPRGLESLPTATHAFLGGTGGHMEDIVAALLERNPKMRIVANVIALESLARILELVRRREIQAEVVSVQVARGWKAGGVHLMKGHNPVYVVSMGGEEECLPRQENGREEGQGDENESRERQCETGRYTGAD